MVDCPINKYCDENYRCRDPCIGASCAYNALCTAINHQAICVCPESSTGDPYDECVSITKSKNKGVFGGFKYHGGMVDSFVEVSDLQKIHIFLHSYEYVEFGTT